MAPTRRRTLAGLATFVTALAGCTTGDLASASDGDGTDPDQTATPSPTETPSPTATPAYDTTVAHDLTAWRGYDPEWSAPATRPPDVRAETVVEGLEIPWDLAHAPNGDLFVTERVGRVRRYTADELSAVVEPADAIKAEAVQQGGRERSWFLDGGEGGTMGVAVHPRYPTVPLVYVYYTAKSDGESENRLVAVDVTADDPAGSALTLLTTPANRYHNGGRLAFGPERYLWVTVGDAGDSEGAQDPNSLVGSVLRLTPDGDAAPDNGSDGDPRVYTYGHRNPQGIAWLPDGTAVCTEHGPGPDEVNVLRPGGNYGWPVARSENEYREHDFSRPVASSGAKTWAPSGCVVPTRGPWKHRLLVGLLGGQRIRAFTLTPDGEESPPVGAGVRYDADWLDRDFLATHHDLTAELGRVRHVAEGPDGLYALTSNRDGRASGEFPTDADDRLVRLRPVER